MKAKKALKRLNKIEELIANLTERYSARVPQMRDVLEEAKAAVVRAKEAVQASSGTAKKAAAKAVPNIAKKATVKKPVAKKAAPAKAAPVKAAPVKAAKTGAQTESEAPVQQAGD